MRLRAALDVLLGCLAVVGTCCLLRREAIYGDGGALLVNDAHGRTVYQGHLLYLPIVAGLKALLAPLGLRPFALLSLASALGTGIGIAGMHAAALTLGLSRGRAALVAAAAFAAPAIVFFGCVIEIHGVFLAPVGWACCAAALLAARGTAARAVLLGAMTGLAALVHLTGLLLPVCLLPLVFAWRREHGTLAAGRLVRDAALVVATHVAVFKAVAWGLDSTGGSSVGGPAAYVLSGLERLSLRALPASLWNELLHAYTPISLAWLLAFAQPRLRPQAWATAGIVACYAAVPFVLLGDSIDEHGAYLVPVAFPLALLVARAVPASAYACLAVSGLLVALAQLRVHDAGVKRWPDARAVAAFTDHGRRALICTTTNELDPVFKHAPTVVPLALDLLLQQGLGDAEVAPRFAAAEASLRARGIEVVVTDKALATLRADPQRRLAGLLAEIEGRHELVRLEAGSLRGWRLLPR